MIIETMELLDTNLQLTVNDLETNINNGVYDDLLQNYNLLIMIGDGLTLINKSDKSCKIIAPTNPETIDLSQYATTNYLSDTLNSMFSFNDLGELVVTINGVSKIFVPKVETEVETEIS